MSDARMSAIVDNTLEGQNASADDRNAVKSIMSELVNNIQEIGKNASTQTQDQSKQLDRATKNMDNLTSKLNASNLATENDQREVTPTSTTPSAGEGADAAPAA
jgi:hypothetical protein